MENGEGLGGEMSTEITYGLSDDEMNGGGDLGCSVSQYSSCGESDFEKYCSANSAMGTPSICGSVGTVFHDFNDLDFGSLKSFKLGDENRSLRSFRGDRRLSSVSGSSSYYKLSTKGSHNGLGGLRNDDSFSKNELDIMHNPYAGDQWRQMEELGTMDSCGDKFLLTNVVNDEGVEENIMNLGSAGGLSSAAATGDGGQSSTGGEHVSLGLGVLEVLSDLEYDEEDAGRCSNEGDTSTRYEHSESEDSMFAYGTDNDGGENIYSKSTTQLTNEGQRVNENMLAINSATAFGTDDWNDFEQEIGENPLGKIGQSELPGVMSSSSSTFEAEGKNLHCNAQDELQGRKHTYTENDNLSIRSVYPTASVASSIVSPDGLEDSKEKYAGRSQVPSARGLGVHVEYQSENKHDKFDEARYQSGFQNTSGLKPSELEQDTECKDPSIENMRHGGQEKEKLYIKPEGTSGVPNQFEVKNMELEEKTNILMNPLSDSGSGQPYTVSGRVTSDANAEPVREKEASSVKSAKENSNYSTNQSSAVTYNHFEEYFTPAKLGTHGPNEYFDEVVYDMEEILMDSNKSQSQNSWFHGPQTPMSMRDGGSTASTSGGSEAYPVTKQRLRVDGVEVIGANQKNGDVSFSERLVGVKEYTVYTIRVFSGDDHWEVERRFRDFRALYHSLKKVFVSQGWILPSPWSSVEQGSRKIFGSSSSDVIKERSELIQECLRSVLHSRFLSSPLDSLITFLSPSETASFSNVSAMPPLAHEDRKLRSSLSLGKTISLVVNLWPRKSMRQLLDAQHHTCAGCHINFNEGKTRMLELAQTLGWGKPRLCEYSGQLFCSSCHTNDTAELPARVLHYWDFAKYPVSQLAKSYLDSIYDQPMLCVGAVNPRLFAKVPALQHVTDTRKRIRAVLPYVRCPFRSSIYKGLGPRRYLLESNEFFALRDLIDLSKGVFAALPVMIDTVSKKIIEHITEQCLVCCDAGIPCHARQACDDPSSLIFPFQEGEIKKCKSCSSAFHKNCIKKVSSCPCGSIFQLEESKGSVSGLSPHSSTLNSSISLFSGLLSKVKPHITRNIEGRGIGDSNNVILMGSLPNTSL